MTEWPPTDPTDADAVAERRDDLVAAVREHAGRIAYRLSRLEGGDYGSREFSTDGGVWTVKYEGGDLEYLRFSPRGGDDVYAVSTKHPPEPTALATALDDYDAFVRAFNDHVAGAAGVLDDVSVEFPEPASAERAVAERDRVLDAIHDVCDRIAGELHRYEGGEYGTFTTRVDGDRWELNWDREGVSYLRVGGEGGVYLLSQYAAPSATDVRRYAPNVRGLVAAYNDHVADLEADLARVEL
ncbi:hypothetical protein Hbl1158_15725 (plasmid) [Halobaculum sp. CBA1158]|uniref:hypothetical protein n=1 Tax=Halobaculum sp. CBA1158 TaxID=2904243 RepID=UPI001F43B372|nr:hypothetical protein [Halobaculum sp. CBA1158]UIP01359.1 hypothetical protein Hbl1158_15725 [Halobaculum sp. CBA1158]